MMAIIGFDEAVLAEVCRETGTWVANINCPGQLVISGAKEDLAKAAELAKTKGARRVIPLPVSGAFHTPLMQPAVDGMTDIIGGLTFNDPTVPIVANTTAQPLTSAESIKEELLRQLSNGIDWQHSIEYMVNEGVSSFIEIGPGTVLTGLIGRINRDIETLNIGDTAAIKDMAG
jgi:[acyl-carrier-protein] S-malonyltransferase